MQCFLDTIESHIIQLDGLELFYQAVQQEGDKQHDFVVCKKVTNDNINTLFIEYNLDDFGQIKQLVDDGFIKQRDEKLLHSEHSSCFEESESNEDELNFEAEQEDPRNENWVYSNHLLTTFK